MALDLPDQHPIGLIGILYAYHIMPDFTAPAPPLRLDGLFLFGLSLVSFSSGLEVFGDRVGPDFPLPYCSSAA